MAPEALTRELDGAGRTLSRWKAQVCAIAWAAVLAASLCLLGISDLLLSFPKPGRLTSWLVLLALAGAALYQVWRILSRKRTIQGTAALIEKAFPELDNHLINYLQFSAAPAADAFKRAYLRQFSPGWELVTLKRMRNRRAQQKAFLALLGGVLLLVIPWSLVGQAWAVSVWRIVNPFSACAPATLTHIVAVEPGNTSVSQGQPLDVLCRVKGKPGHRVRLDLRPSGDEPASYDLGAIATANEAQFAYRIPKVMGPVEYRFCAGDAPATGWFQVEARPPLAFTRISLSVAPPAYTRLAPRTFNAMSEAVTVPANSALVLSMEANRDLKSASAVFAGRAAPLPLARSAEPRRWTGRFAAGAETLLKLSARDSFGEEVQGEVQLKGIPDLPPQIKVLKPEGRVALSPGEAPAIRFEVTDDYGLSRVSIERATSERVGIQGAAAVREWPVENRKEMAALWTGTAEHAARGETLAFQIVAADGASASGQVSRSATILFDLGGGTTITNPLAGGPASRLSLGRICELQRVNIADTKDRLAELAAAATDVWTNIAGRQKEIRQLTGEILNRAAGALGAMEPVVRDLYMQEMVEAVSALGRVLEPQGAARQDPANRALTLEETILRKLTYASAVADKTAAKRRVADILSLLDGLVSDQAAVLEVTLHSVSNRTVVGAATVEKQDGLASRTEEFTATCRRELPALQESDKRFADLVTKTATECERLQIKPDMLRAAEKLEGNDAGGAAPIESRALANLRELQKALSQWQVANAEEQKKEVVEALEDAKQRMQKLRALEEKLVEAMKQVKPTEDKANRKDDLLEEEAKELQDNVKEAMLEVAKDLQIFKEMTVANEMVEDVFNVFDEMKQAEGSEKLTAKDAQEIGVLKPDEMIEAMKRAEGRIDDMEFWLEDKPEAFKWNQEAYDEQEMPKMALGALAAETEDVIGELLKEKDDLDKATDDSPTNVGSPDLAMGWGVLEGPQSSFAAKGKSGNQRPDHKEQDGRSNVGRQGMSDGETAAGSGTINEGDKNIEKRMTQEPNQSGQVQAEGKADANATGGGKLASGSAKEQGMAGSGKRMDSTEAGTAKGLESLMARAAALHVKASLLNVRADSLGSAAHHIFQADDAVARGLPISQVKEFERKALAALRQARAELSTAGGATAVAKEDEKSKVEEMEETDRDQVPAAYRNLVSEYFKSLGGSL